MKARQVNLELEQLLSPIYLVTDVARYAKLPVSTTRYWVGLIPGRAQQMAGLQGLNFLDLVSILVMRELRRTGVRPSRVREAERYLTEYLGPYPFAHASIWTDGDHVLFNPASPLRQKLPEDHLVTADMQGQQAFVTLIHQYLRMIDYNAQNLAMAWRPVKGIRLDPLMQFGQPCLTSTRITTQAVFSLYRAGDHPRMIGKSYGISLEDVESAIQWEESLLQRAA